MARPWSHRCAHTLARAHRYYGVFDSRKLALVERAFGAAVALSVLLQVRWCRARVRARTHGDMRFRIWSHEYPICPRARPQLLYALAPLTGMPLPVVVAVHHSLEAALNLAMAGVFAALHRRVARALPPAAGEEEGAAAAGAVVRFSTALPARGEDGDGRMQTRVGEDGGGGGGGGGGAPPAAAGPDTQRPLLSDDRASTVATSRRARARKQSRLTVVSFMSSTGLVLHALTVIYIAYLVRAQAGDNGSSLPGFAVVLNSATFDVALVYEVGVSLAFLYVTKARSR